MRRSILLLLALLAGTGEVYAQSGQYPANQFLGGPTSGGASLPAPRALVGADLPNPGASSLGGIESITCSTHTWLDSISTGGVPACAQPAFSDLSGNIATSQMNSGTGASSSTFFRGDGTWATPAGGGSATIVGPQGYLTLQSGTPIQTADQVNKGTIFYDCFKGGNVPYYNGSADALDTITSCEASLTLEPSGAGVENASDLFDIWWWHNSGSPVLCVATNNSGGGWASDTGGSLTARGTGYSQLDFTTRSFITNANSISHCFNGATDYGPVNAHKGTYLGTFYTTAAGQTGIALHPAYAAGGSNNIIGLSNCCNRQRVVAIEGDSTASWTYQSATWRAADASNSNRVSFVDGLQRSPIFATYGNQVTVNNFAIWGVDLDSTSTAPSGFAGLANAEVNGLNTSGFNSFYPQMGFHYVQAIERSQATSAATFSGTVQSMALEFDMMN